MNKITVYEKSTCITCRKVAKAFSDQGISFEKIDYYTKPFSKSLLQSLLNKMSLILQSFYVRMMQHIKDLKIVLINYLKMKFLNL